MSTKTGRMGSLSDELDAQAEQAEKDAELAKQAELKTKRSKAPTKDN